MAALPGCQSKNAPGPGRPIAILSALPLFGQTAALKTLLSGPDQRAAIVRSLSRQHRLIALARIEGAALDGTTLILAQPRGLSGEELVALDRWVRDGGRVLVFSDPELLWPVDLPLGDPRRAPPVELLDPLFAHWGLTLDDRPADDAGPLRSVIIDGRSVAVAWAGQWSTRSPDCRIESDRLIADCRIGKGRALLVADADMLDERLWSESGLDNERAILALVARVERTLSKKNGATGGT